MNLTKFNLTIAIFLILILAAIKNPSKDESRNSIKTELHELLKEKMLEAASTSEDCDASQTASTLAGIIAPALIEQLVKIEINDYIFFTTFNAHSITSHSQPDKKLMSGVIVFGKLMPLNYGTEVQ